MKIFLALLLVLILVFVFSLDWTQKQYESFYDRFYTCEKSDVNSNIVILTIDDLSLKTYGLWPWKRAFIAEILNKLEAESVKAIALDINFVESSDKNDDQLLQNVLNKYSNIIPAIEAKKIFYRDNVFYAEKFLLPYFISNNYAFVNFINSDDNIVRYIPNKLLDFNTGKEYVPLASKLVNKNWPNVLNRIYYCPSNYFQQLSVKDFLDGNYQIDLKGKYVLLGLTVADLHDYVYTPISHGNYIYGVFVHANAVNTLLENKFLFNLDSKKLLLFLFFFLLFYVIYLFYWEDYILFNVFSVLVLSVFFYFLSFYLFNKNLLFPAWYFILSTIIVYSYVFIIHYYFLFRNRQYLKRAFSYYLSPDVLDDLLENPSKLKLGGVQKNMTVLFSDIRSFTSISENLSASQLVSLLNIYLTEMTAVIFENKGVVDKYIGDAIMAFWGAPMKDKYHAINACKTALAMLENLDYLNKNKVWTEELNLDYDIELNIGIGINTGEMVVGNVGGEQRFDYTVIGDNVNLASRLEGLNKMYGTKIIISEYTYNLVKDKFYCRLLDKVAVKGKNKAVKIYELVDYQENITAKQEKEFKKFQKILDLYFARRFEEALELLENLEMANEKLKNLYIARFKYMKVDDDWDGTSRLNQK